MIAGMKPKLTDALRAIVGRSDEIVALAENEERNLPEIFSFRQNNITIQACLEAVDAECQTRSDRNCHAREVWDKPRPLKRPLTLHRADILS